MTRALLLLVLGSLTAPVAGALGRHAPPTFPRLARSELQIATNSGLHPFKVWIADDDQSRERGLMFVRSLPADHGMLFLFERPQYAAFWMKNTYLSLDMIFIAADGTVVNIAADTTPLSLDPVQSAAPVKAVLELPAGTSQRIGLKAGARIRHPAFAAADSSSDINESAIPQTGNTALHNTR